MRTKTHLLGLGVGTALTTAALMAALGGCGLADGGITVVGANPGRVSVPVSVVAPGTAGTGTARPTGAAAAGAAAESASISRDGAQGEAAGGGAAAGSPGGGGHGDASCTAADLRLQATWTPTTPGPSPTGNAFADRPSTTRSERLTLVFTNVSASTCYLRGFPNVDFLRGGNHGPLSEPDAFSTVLPANRVELAPGGAASASATFVTNDPQNVRGSRCDDAVGVRTFPPGSSAALSSGVHDTHGAPLSHFYVCGHGVVVSALQA